MYESGRYNKTETCPLFLSYLGCHHYSDFVHFLIVTRHSLDGFDKGRCFNAVVVVMSIYQGCNYIMKCGAVVQHS